ncbi:LamG-like jellyroll fold domain-containing protein [Carboxylicivirga linearis]|uniref:Cadherin-like beta sandwich domain-containing protein n=1 Tax=Carboxylicivirga linearis TaxID=1628157 RepID=A0ABS5JY87_9BACT|nr:LamG-like jellyroll fold domain-containing protein [Carboxylicivirga linearis]MBS2099391.1 cadherin-like beta sandwich domain-containing protein [Carboxylicivirga linearis]
MKKGFLLLKFWSVLMVLGIFSTASLTGQTLMHSYTFEDGTFEGTTVYDQTGDLDGTLGGDRISIADGMCTVAGATANNHGWMSVDGTALALNSYSSITFEAFLVAGDNENNGVFTMLGYFGGTTPGDNCFWYQPTRSGNESRAETDNGTATITAAAGEVELDDGKMHHVVVVLTGTELSYYLDGALLSQVSTEGADYISTIGTDVANFFRGVDGWNDPNYNGSVDEFNIYDGAMDQTTIESRWVDYVGDDYINSSLASLSATPGEFEDPFDPAVFDNYLNVPYATTQVEFDIVTAADVATYTVYEGTSGDEFTDDIVTFDENGIDIVIEVFALSGTSTKYYVSIYVDEGTYDDRLQDIELSVSALDPVFDPDVLDYSVIVPNGTASVDVAGIPFYSATTVTGNGTVTITGGTGSISLTTVAETGGATRTYNVSFTEADGLNYALNLDGNDGQTSNVDISGLNLTTLPYTMEMWFKPSAVPQSDYAGMIMNGSNTVNGMSYVGWQRDYDAMRLNATGNGDQYAGPTVTHEITEGWHHVAAIVTENSRTLILDGVEYNEAANFTPVDWTQEKTYIGAWDGYWSRTFSGLVDEVKIWNDSISPEILSANKYDALNGDETGLLAYYSFDLQNSSQAVDMAADAHHGLITGGTYEVSFDRANLELSSLMIDDEMIQGFVSTATEYRITLPVGTTTINVAATTADATAKISGVGDINVSDGAGSIILTVTSADDLYSRDYVIHYLLDTELTLMHSYTFTDGTARDTISGANGFVTGGFIENGMFVSDPTGYVTLPAEDIAINSFPSITMEAYVKAGNNTGNTMLTYWGGLSGSNTYWVSVQNEADYTRATVDQGSGQYRSETAGEAAEDGIYHYVTTLTNDSISLYINGAAIGKTALPADYSIYGLSNENAWICYSGYAADPVWLGSVYEFNVYSGEMDDITILNRAQNLPEEDNTMDATLSTLRLDGDTIEGFHSANLEYTVALEDGTVPVIDGVVKVDGAEITTITPPDAIPGVGTVLVTALDGTTTNTYTINFEIATGVEKPVKESAIKVYPTVSTGEFTVEMEGQTSMITVYDLAGRLVKQVKTNSQREIISLNQKGMYIVKVHSDDETKLFKVFKR